jgi:hypothetical protein
VPSGGPGVAVHEDGCWDHHWCLVMVMVMTLRKGGFSFDDHDVAVTRGHDWIAAS